MKKFIQELTQKEVLSLAISIERANYLSMKAFAQFFEGNDELDIAIRFRELADEELEHEAILTRRYFELFGEETPDTVDFEFDDLDRKTLKNEFEGMPPSYFDKAQKVFELALINENRAREFYQAAAEAVPQKELRLLFMQLAAMEDNHSGWLVERIGKDKITSG